MDKDKDSGKIASGSAIVGFVSAELRWRQGKPAGDLWTWSGAPGLGRVRGGVTTVLQGAKRRRV